MLPALIGAVCMLGLSAANQELVLPHVGAPNFGGPMATASGLVFIGAAIDNYLRAFDAASGKVRVAVDPDYFRPTEVVALRGDSAKARAAFGWQHTITFERLVREMVEADRKLLVQPEPGTARASR